MNARATTEAPPRRAVRLAPETELGHACGEIVLTGPLRRAAVSAEARPMIDAIADWTDIETACAACPPAVEPLTVLRACRAAGALDEAVRQGERVIAEIRIAPGSGLGREPAGAATAPFRFVEHVALEPASDGWRVASPCAPGVALLHDPELLPSLSRAAGAWRPEAGVEAALASLLAAAGLLISAEAPAPEAQLASHELRLHALSRPGSSSRAFGATRRDPAPAPPAMREDAGEIVQLPQPPREAARSFRALLDRRRSRRAAGGTIPRERLGALLWLCARNLGPPRRDETGFERLRRPCPAGGGAGEIDLYIADASGVARYDAALHALRPLPGPPDALLREAGAAMGMSGPPAALIVLGARFGRITWKYGDASYALILKNAGAMLQTLHLGATALDLASCIIGAGDSRAFARATETDPLFEGPVGEIALTGTIDD